MKKNNTEGHDEKAKKDRVTWSQDLNHKFLLAVNHLGGIQTATPKKILPLMKCEKLTKENVASHLQKYRLHLKRVSNNTFQRNQEGPAHFHDINDVIVHNGYESGVSQAIPTPERYPKQGLEALEALLNDTSFEPLSFVQKSITTPSSCTSQELHEIAELRHEVTTFRHENRQLLEVVQVIKAQQDMLVKFLLQ